MTNRRFIDFKSSDPESGSKLDGETTKTYEKIRNNFIEFTDKSHLNDVFGRFVPHAFFGCHPSVFSKNVETSSVTRDSDGKVTAALCKEVSLSLDMPSFLSCTAARDMFNFSNEGYLKRTNDLPAKIIKSNIKDMMTLEWYSGGSLHRLSGPAIVEVHANTLRYTARYYVDNQGLTRSEFVKQYELLFLEEYTGL